MDSLNVKTIQMNYVQIHRRLNVLLFGLKGLQIFNDNLVTLAMTLKMHYFLVIALETCMKTITWILL